ncbi:MAG: AMP-binding protein [Fibrobacter sp.]|jgi:acyl-[acyl-carrier-protein]-phospholipid O-acyltransferase/long-chain-fatty-acid--[acyl-carrier-protein] ligase|nr:AMP-binding protein [Fibrobacter sp.]
MKNIHGFFPFLGLVFAQIASVTVLATLVFLFFGVAFPSANWSYRYLLIGLMLLPAVIFPTPAGYFSDKYPKERVLSFTVFLSIPLFALSVFMFYQGWWQLLLALLFLLFVLLAFHGPSKYGYLKELVGIRYLSPGMGSLIVVSVVSAVFAAGITVFLFQKTVPAGVSEPAAVLKDLFPLSWLAFGFSVLSAVFVSLLPMIGMKNREIVFRWKDYFRLVLVRRKLKKAWRNRPLRQSFIGLTMFWVTFLMIALIIQNTAAFYSPVVILGALGLVLGCFYAIRMSRNYIETGLVPLGTAGLSICIFMLPYFTAYPVVEIILIGALGFFGGLFIVPMRAMLLYQTKPRSSGHVVSMSSAVRHAVLLIVCAFSVLLIQGLHLSRGQLFFILALFSFSGTVWAVLSFPQSLLRQLLKGVLTMHYRFHVLGLSNLPWEGPVLLVGNHISYIDWALLQMASPRPIRMMLQRQFYEKWYIRILLNRMQVIVLDPKNPAEAMKAANEALRRREAVAIFPEISISQTGNVGRFRLDYSEALEHVPGVSLIPFYVQGLWGSSYSMASAHYRENIRNRGVRSVSVAFGAALPVDSSPVLVKNKVQELSILAWESYIRTLKPLAQSWLRIAKKVGSAPSVFNPDGNHFSGISLLAAALTFGKKIEKLCEGEERVGILLPPSGPGIIVNLACLIKAKLVVNLNYTNSAETLLLCSRRAKLKTIITARAFESKLKDRGLSLEILKENFKVVYMEDLKDQVKKSSLVINFIRARVLPAWWLEWRDFKKVSLDDVGSILFSSGSEGTPKGVELTHFNFMGNIKQCMSVLNPTADDVMLSILPLFHAFGFSITTMMCLVEGIPLVAYPDPTDAKMIGRLCAEYKVTVLVGTGTFFRIYGTSRFVHPLMFSSLRALWAGAEKLRNEVRDLYRTKFKKEIYEGFGTTETTPVASVNTEDILLDDFQTVQPGNKPGTVGTPLPGTQFKIVDPDTLQELPIGEDGLILVGGAQIMKGYLDEPERTAQAIAVIDGKRWYKTGDKGHVDDDGFVYIVDRYSRFAKIGGEMVSLGAVELKISESGIFDESDFCAVAIPDEVKGERIVLFYTAKMEKSEVKEKIRTAGLPPLMQPSLYFQVDEIPKLGSGKSDFAGAKALAVRLHSGGSAV